MAGEIRVTADWVGCQAQADLAACQDARILGATSQGVYLNLNHHRVVFLTHALPRGPLTVNLPEDVRILDKVQPDATVFVHGAHILIPDCTEINLLHSPIWTPPPPGEAQGAQGEWWERLRRVAGELHTIKGAGGFSFLLSALFQPPGTTQLDRDQAATVAQVRELQAALQQKRIDDLPGLLTAFLGQGRGLTPSGDDLVCGVILTLNRWGQYLLPGSDFTPIFSPIAAAAYAQTTSISASLIDMAAHGWAGERLLHGLDYLMTGKPALSEAVRALAGFGSSSGMDTLAGMGLVVGSYLR